MLPAEIYSRYDVLRALGQGGMGIVYEATDRETGAKVALKILKPDVDEPAETAARLKTELLLARKITHKNVCRVYDMSRFGGLAVIAMKQVNETPVAPRELVPDLPEFVEAAVRRCIEKERSRRFGSVGELRAALTAPPAEAPAIQESTRLAPRAGGRSLRIGWIVAVALLLVAGILSLSLFRSGPPASQSAAVAAPPQASPAPPTSLTPQQASGPSVAILDFANLQKDSQYAHLEVGISEAFTASFVRSKRFRVVERNQLEKVRAELQLNRSEFVDQATAQRIGRLVGAQYLLFGSFQAPGGVVRINARLIRVETGEIVHVDSMTGNASSALSMPDTLAERFLSQIQ
jgi:TolB-like protein